jgi:protease-4
VRNKDWYIGIGIVAAVLFCTLIIVMFFSSQSGFPGLDFSFGGSKIAVIELNGPFYNSRRIVRQFRHFGRQQAVRAIVFRIDSPGGGVAAAQEIYEAVKRVRDKGKPIIASFGSVAASGGYYVACGSDTIISNPGTTTGSIGVVAQFINVKDLMDKLGIRLHVVKSGMYKDTGSPHRDMTPADRRHLQAWIDDAYEQFVDVVAEERVLPRKTVLQLADGRVYTGRQALENGLVDMLGDYQDAIELATRLGGIKGSPTIVRERRRSITLFDLLFREIEGLLRGLNGTVLQYRY